MLTTMDEECDLNKSMHEGGSRIIVQSIKHELGQGFDIKQEIRDATDSTLTLREDVQSVNKEPDVVGKSDEPPALKDFTCYRGQVTRDEITIKKEEPNWWHEVEVPAWTSKPSSDETEARGHISFTEDLKQERCDLEFVSVREERVAENETRAARCVDPLAVGCETWQNAEEEVNSDLETANLRTPEKVIIVEDRINEPSRCPRCRKMFVHRRNLMLHMRSACGLKERHKCLKCNKSFSRKYNLMQHMEHDCSRLHPHKCTTCSKTFACWQSLVKHANQDCEHREVRECPKCSKLYKWGMDLKRHLRKGCNGVKELNLKSKHL